MWDEITSALSPAVTSSERRQDMVPTLYVPLYTLPPAALTGRLVMASVLVSNSEWSLQQYEEVKHTHLLGVPVCLAHTAPSPERFAVFCSESPTSLQSGVAWPERGPFFWLLSSPLLSLWTWLQSQMCLYVQDQEKSW